MDVNYQRKLIEKHDKLFLASERNSLDSTPTPARQHGADAATIPYEEDASADYVVAAHQNRLGLPCLVLDAEREFQHDETRLRKIFATLARFLGDNKIIVPPDMARMAKEDDAGRPPAMDHVNHDGGGPLLVDEDTRIPVRLAQ